MKKFSFVLVLLVSGFLCMGNMGCDDAKEAKGKVDKGANQVTFVANGITYAVDKADPIVAELEKVTGISLDADTVDSGIGVADTAETGLQTAAGIASVIPGGQSIATVLLALSTLAGGVGAFLENRKKKKAMSNLRDSDVQRLHIMKIASGKEYELKNHKEALGAVLMGVTGVDKIGTIITTAARKAGQGDLVEATYQLGKEKQATVATEEINEVNG